MRSSATLPLCLLTVLFHACGATAGLPDGGGGGGTGGGGAMTSTATLRLVHLSPGAPAIDAFADEGGAAVRDLAFGAGSTPQPVAVGASTVRVTAAGQPANLASLEGVRFDEGRDYTAFAFGQPTALQLSVVENDRQGLSSGNVRLRVVHAADGVGTVDVLQVGPTGATPLVQALRYGTAAAPLDVPAQAFTVALDVDRDGAADFSFDVPALPAGTVVNVFAVLDPSGAPLLYAQLSGATVVRLDAATAQLQVLHLSPDAPAVTPLVDGAVPAGFSALRFTEASPVATVTAGQHEAALSTDGTPAGAVLSASFPLVGGRAYSVVALGRVASLRALLVESPPVSAERLSVRAVHAAPSVGTVDVLALGADGVETPVVTDLAFAAASAVLTLPPAASTLGVDVDRDGRSDLFFSLPALPAGTTANVYVTEDAQGAVFALAQLGDGSVVRVDPSTSSLRVVHLSRNAPAVDVYADGAKAVSNLAYASATQALTVPSGARQLALTAAGAPLSSAVLTVPGVQLLPGRRYTVVALGDLPNLEVSLLEDDASGLNTATDIRLRITHVATTVTRGDVYAVKPSGNTLLVPDIGFGETKPRLDLASSSYTVGFDAESNGTIDLAFDLPVLAPGSFANVFVATDAGGQVYLLIQTTAAGVIRVDPRP